MYENVEQYDDSTIIKYDHDILIPVNREITRNHDTVRIYHDEGTVMYKSDEGSWEYAYLDLDGCDEGEATALINTLYKGYEAVEEGYLVPLDAAQCDSVCDLREEIEIFDIRYVCGDTLYVRKPKSADDSIELEECQQKKLRAFMTSIPMHFLVSPLAVIVDLDDYD